MTHLRLVPSSEPSPDVVPSAPSPVGADGGTGPERPVVPIKLLLALSGRCSCIECCAKELINRAGREWVHPELRAPAPMLRAVQ